MFELTIRVSDLEDNLGLAAEAIGGLGWLVEELADAAGITFTEEAAQIRALIG